MLKSQANESYFFLFRRVKENPVDHVRDILVQEIMSMDNSEFSKEAIDMDSISFAGKEFINRYLEKSLTYLYFCLLKKIVG